MNRILEGDPLAWRLERPTALTIGVFDGVHLGHQTVLRRVAAYARAHGLLAAALTFDPHPLEFLAPERAPKLLTDVEQRAELMGENGIELVGVLPFLQIRDLPAPSFATEVLGRRLQARHVCVGADFRFGRDRRGDAGLLGQIGAEHGFDVEVVEMVEERDGELVSSTRIRGLVSEGRVKDAARLLGRPFELRGTVIHGEARGASIGFPTANVHVPDRMAVPADGVYAVWASFADGHRPGRGGGEALPAVVNIGVRPTFGTSARTVEAHLLDFEGDIYGERLALGFVERLRAERRFEGVEELVRQIERDVEQGRELLRAVG